jgi:phosphoribosylformylglycinamidine cyclo-ligase
MAVTYREAGVDIDAGDALVERIKPLARATHVPGVLGGIGGFGGLFALKEAGGWRDPVLVSGTDGVGTKLKLAFALDRHDTVGIDLVAMCVNDVITTGAKPLFFLDYFATGALSVEQGEAVIRGIATGCREAGCALLGGETAEMPGFYPKGEYDLAGFAVGIVERDAILDGRRVRAGDAVIGVASSGVHSNGLSLARRVLPWQDDPALADALLTPTRIYVRAAQALMRSVDVRGLAHITGGGLPGNLPRCLPDGLGARLHRDRWPVPPIFGRIAAAGPVADEEMLRTFNLGLGLCAVVPAAEAERAVSALASTGESAWIIGEIVPGEEVSWA